MAPCTFKSNIDKWDVPFTSSFWVEILGVNIQCCSLSKHKMEISKNAQASIIEKFTKERKNALIKMLAYNF